MPISNRNPVGPMPGTVAHFANSTAPAGWLKCNGALVSRTAYAALFAAIGTTYGVGDGATTFGLPDLRGEFLRGLDDGRGVDVGRAIGSAQAATKVGGAFFDSTGVLVGAKSDTPIQNGDEVGATTTRRTGNVGADNGTAVINYATRPRNVAMLACIKF